MKEACVGSVQLGLFRASEESVLDRRVVGHDLGDSGVRESSGSVRGRFTVIGVNATGDAGKASPAIIGQPGTKCLYPQRLSKMLSNCLQD